MFSFQGAFWVSLSRNSMKSHFHGTSVNSLTVNCQLSTLLLVESTGIEPVTSCLQGRRSPSWANPPVQGLYQILAKWWAKMDSNHRPHDYQSCALASWAIGPFRSLRSSAECFVLNAELFSLNSELRPLNSELFLRAVPSKLNNVKYLSLCTDLRTLLEDALLF